MGPSSPSYRHQGVQGGSPSAGYSTNRQSGSKAGPHEREEHGYEVEPSRNVWGGKRRASPVYGDYTDSTFAARESGNEKSLASYGSWTAASHTLNNISASTSTSDSKSKNLMSPYGNYDMDDSSFFAHTTRLSIVGPSNSNSSWRRSSSTERLLISAGERSLVTTATSPKDRERSRSLSPPVIIKLIPDKRILPTEAYMKLSLQPSLRVEDLTTSRKLLVLDLNGTLLLRSAHSSRRAPPPPSYSRIRHSADTPSHPRTAPSAPQYPYPAPRTIYPRPYLPSFCAYLFHPTTLQWLDTMVWSSAQPHSVNDMVGKCFGMYRGELKAVWARDTLGLSSDQYYKKTQTTKDLAKPWAQIPSFISNPNHDPSSPSQPRSTSHPPENLSSEEVKTDGNIHASPSQQQHSALTTVLMDDSPLKAILQPWNHLCVSEYGSQRRKLDVEIAERDLGLMRLTDRERTNEISSSEVTEEGEKKKTGDETAMKTGEESDKEAERKRKRKEKKMLKKEKLLLVKEQELVERREKGEGGGVVRESYDETLLAVIGILDRLKHEGNVAGWMRSGGLLHVGNQESIIESNNIDGSAGTPTPPSDNAETETTTTATTTPTPRTTMTIPIPNPPTTFTATSSPSTPSTKRDGSSMPIRGPSKRRRLTHVNDSSGTEMDPISVLGERTLEADSDSEIRVGVVLPTAPTTIRKSPSASLLSSPLSSSAQAEQAWTGVPLVVSADPSTSPSGNKEEEESSSSSSSTQQSQQPLLWYETPSILSHWAKLGRKALTELEIEIVTGVVPPSQNGHSVGRQNSLGVRL